MSKNKGMPLAAALACAVFLLAGCGSSGGDDSGDDSGLLCTVSVSGSEELVAIPGGDYDFVTEIYTEVTYFNDADQPSVDVFVEGVKSPVYNAGNHSYQTLLDRLVPAGEAVHVAVSLGSGETQEFDLVVCGFPGTDYLDSIDYSPSLDALLRSIDSGSGVSPSLTVAFPSTAIPGMSEIETVMFANRVGDGVDALYATASGNDRVFDLSSGNASWNTVRDTLVASRSGWIENRFRWSAEYALGDRAKIKAEYLGYENLVNFSPPPKVEGSYTLTADYRATSVGGGGYVNVSDHSDVFGITRDYEDLSIPSKSGVTGTCSSSALNDVTLTGDIIGTASMLAEQTLKGDVWADGSIHGTISGTVMQSFPGGGGEEQATISDGEFILTPQ